MNEKILVQIGSADGNDHVTEILKEEKNIKAILIEPNFSNFLLLKECYKNYTNIIFENIAISNIDGKLSLYVENTPVSYHGSSNYNHLLAHGHSPHNIKKIDVDCLRLETLLTKYNLNNEQIEYLFIDTEGHDCDIILDTDFNKFKIKNICFEIFHSDGPRTQGEKFNKTKKHLESFGFVVDETKEISWSIWMKNTNEY